MCVELDLSLESVLHEARTTSDSLRDSLSLEIQRNADLMQLLNAERQSCTEAHSDCQTLANKLVETKKTLSRVESQLESAQYAIYIWFIYCIVYNMGTVHALRIALLKMCDVAFIL
jgi:hypothetical protein